MLLDIALAMWGVQSPWNCGNACRWQFVLLFPGLKVDENTWKPLQDLGGALVPLEVIRLMVVTPAIPVVSSIRWLIQSKVLVSSCDCQDRSYHASNPQECVFQTHESKVFLLRTIEIMNNQICATVPRRTRRKWQCLLKGVAKQFLQSTYMIYRPDPISDNLWQVLLACLLRYHEVIYDNLAGSD